MFRLRLRLRCKISGPRPSFSSLTLCRPPCQSVDLVVIVITIAFTISISISTATATASPKTESTYKLGIKKALGYGGFIGLVGGLGQVTLVGLLWYGGELVLSGDMTAGVLITFMMYSLNTGASLAVFAGLFSAFMDAMGASVRTFQIIDREPALALRGGHKIDALEGGVVFESVSFRYPTRVDSMVLQDFNLSICRVTHA